MGLIKKVQHEEKQIITVRMEVGLLDQLDRYAKYLGGTREYVITKAVEAALKLADAKDEEWVAFSGKATSSKVRGAKREMTLNGRPVLGGNPS
jgi:predicted transcriptional regulator